MLRFFAPAPALRFDFTFASFRAFDTPGRAGVFPFEASARRGRAAARLAFFGLSSSRGAFAMGCLCCTKWAFGIPLAERMVRNVIEVWWKNEAEMEIWL
ncbi:hypothetical protein [Sabulicella glaciei]|uniref:Uncharacterized protein n=1 Tax=Sabulicella glaciei TaxID=2984948 RepID=A0ABT3NPC2_9PROT|nr:hypothetical protein [Roseococcus sp. MDT2-1-1]MCW8084003.1 hypothetical protein [Roseococcus sp. MDT2-1-1]